MCASCRRMAPTSSPYDVFRSSDWNSVVAEPNGLSQCLRIALKKLYTQMRYNPAEEWEHPEEDTLKHTRSASVFMTCQHFNCCCDRHCRTILTCHLHQRLIPHGDHLTSKCRSWMQRLERKIGWCPELA